MIPNAEQLFGRGSNPNSRIPASDAAISRCSKVRFEELTNDNSVCPVCTEHFSETSDIIKLPCNHVFDRQCVVDWLRQKNSCPVCRSQIPD